MELELKFAELACCEPVGDLVTTQEESMETAIPEYCPDIARIVDTVGQRRLREMHPAGQQLTMGGSVVLTVLYMLARGQRRPLKEVAPGVGISLAAWMVLSLAFSYYVENFANYSVLYGSIATVVVVLLWLYMSGTVLIMGAVYSAVILRRWRSRLPESSGEEQA